MQKNRNDNPEEYNVGVCVNCRISLDVVSSRVTHFPSPPPPQSEASDPPGCLRGLLVLENSCLVNSFTPELPTPADPHPLYCL